MNVKVDNISKRYAYSWIIKEFTKEFKSGSITGISGPNGSGKSTLMKMLSTYLPATKGNISYTKHQTGQTVKAEEAFKQISFVAPYTDVVREFSLKELFTFHGKFKSWRGGLDYTAFKDILGLPNQKGKEIQYFSSGMNQRVQLALGILSDTSLLLLDEPTSYLDAKTKQWAYDLLGENKSGRTIILASNDPDDFVFNTDFVDIT